MDEVKQETAALHYGYDKDAQNTMAVPIYMSTAYKFNSIKHAANLFSLKELGNIYTRLTNPTNSILEKRFAKIEGGTSAIATSSGMNAIFSTIVNLCEAGDNIIVAKTVYGGTSILTDHTIKRFGIETRKFNVTKPSKLESLIDDKTKIILFESLSNPNLQIADFDTIVQISNKYNIITIVDNTIATPYICNPIKLGCDIVIHSTSKYTTGQGLALGGIIIDSPQSKQKIIGNKRYDHFNKPDKSYHGLVYAKLPYSPFTMRLLLNVLKDLGGTASPFNSWLMIQGLETLHLRIKRHSKSALKIAKFLDKHPRVKKVNYSGIKTNSNNKRALKYFRNKHSGLLSFEVKNFKKAKKIVDNIDIFSCAANIGDSKSIITHPASTTHQQLNKKELKSAKIGKGLIRLSIGLENSYDLIKALQKVL